MKFIYVGDPMCSWCYGFGKELQALRDLHPGVALEIIVGGLRAGGTDVLDDAGKTMRLSHWARVEAASGLPFNRDGLMARQNFVYDTEPVCRAVVAARMAAPEADLLQVFQALQEGFYVAAADTTDGRVLARLAADALTRLGHAVDVDDLFRVWSSDAAIAAAQQEFAYSRKLGIHSFPTLLVELDEALYMLSPGYARLDELQQRLQDLLAAAGSPAAASASA